MKTKLPSIFVELSPQKHCNKFYIFKLNYKIKMIPLTGLEKKQNQIKEA